MTSSPLRRALRTRLTAALRERDRAGASVLRSVLATLENSEAVPDAPDRGLVESDHVAGAVTGVAARSRLAGRPTCNSPSLCRALGVAARS